MVRVIFFLHGATQPMVLGIFFLQIATQGNDLPDFLKKCVVYAALPPILQIEFSILSSYFDSNKI